MKRHTVICKQKYLDVLIQDIDFRLLFIPLDVIVSGTNDLKEVLHCEIPLDPVCTEKPLSRFIDTCEL